MSMGAVLFRVGTVKGSELGGLYKSMPWTTGFCMVGAASISAFPLFSGFVTKSMVITAAHGRRLFLDVDRSAVRQRRRLSPCRHQDPLLCLLRARLGQAMRGSARQHAGGDGDHGGALHRHRHVPGDRSTRLLPFKSDYRPYSLDHVVAQMQLLFLSALGIHLADADRHLSARVALDEPRLRLVLPSPRF